MAAKKKKRGSISPKKKNPRRKTVDPQTLDFLTFRELGFYYEITVMSSALTGSGRDLEP